VLDAVGARLAEHGVTLRFFTPTDGASDDATAPLGTQVELSRGRDASRYLAVVARRATLAAVRTGALASHPPVLVVAEHLDPKTVASLRRARVQYADGCGNALLHFEHVHVDVEGRTAARRTLWRSPSAAARAVENLFSTRWSQVVMVLLAWPRLWSAPVRDVAAAAGVTPKQAREALELLAQAGYRADPGDPTRTVDTLLDFWTSVYATGLLDQLRLADFVGDPTRPLVAEPGRRLWLSGERAFGPEVVAPTSITVYVTDLDPTLPAGNRWLEDTGESANVHVRRAFWTVPPAALRDRREDGHTAPWPLVYADLRSLGRDDLADRWRSRFA
jgi:hypothetical protein